jgi:Restriction endonuclease BamHI
MKYIKEELLINKKRFSTNKEYRKMREEIIVAIESITWPSDSDKFTINPQRHANGVVPIKQAFIAYLKKSGWETEIKVDVEATATTPGKIDAVKMIKNKYFAVEWETGNISSSHRALNKIVIGILSGKLAGGSLIIPTRNFYYFLTDRIGNY